MRDFTWDRVNCYRDFLRTQNKLWKTSEKIRQRKLHQKCGHETNKHMSNVQNWVFMHCTRKTLRNNKIKNTLGCISTWQDRFKKNNNIERGSKNLELFNQPLDQKLIDVDKENKNFYEKNEVTINDRQNKKSQECRTSEGQQLVRELRSEVMQLKASAAPQNLTRDLEAKIENHK